ncbi:MAG: L-histidine N(alpha)-methyltransferase [Polyangiaceae bacterium]|nr:L-histidine N(alpha)-methyltransferase [Polyangiaceae bacterium]
MAALDEEMLRRGATVENETETDADAEAEAEAGALVDDGGLLGEVLAGLGASHKRLPAKLFYDEAGSQLFEQICALDEYYPTRTEIGILRAQAGDIAERLGPHCRLVEFGSGSSAKTHVLLDALKSPSAYVPIDISPSALEGAAEELSRRYPGLAIEPLCTDFTRPLSLGPARPDARRTAVFFPGSTVGNFEPAEARALLAQMAGLAGRGGGVLVGIDLKKDPALLHAAYNDRRGVTAAFNRNALVRLNREFGGTFPVEGFAHYAFYNPGEGRIEMHLVSDARRRVEVAGQSFSFEEGESIVTEYSHKYSVAGFRQLAASVGLGLREVWVDSRRHFAVLYLETEP